MSPHALDRITERVPDMTSIRATIAQAEQAYPRGSVAVRVATLPQHRGDDAADFYAREHSNGNEVWAVIRDGWCCTVMLRRSDQRREPFVFRTDRVVLDFTGGA